MDSVSTKTSHLSMTGIDDLATAITDIDAIETALDGKQPTIGNDHLDIAHFFAHSSYHDSDWSKFDASKIL